jgi:hypothetical protein
MNDRLNDKEFFDIRIGHWHAVLRREFQWRDRNTGKVHCNYVFRIQKRTYESWDTWFEFYTGWRHPNFEYHTAEYEGNRHYLSASIGWGKIYWYFPWRNKKVTEDDVNDPQPVYGFYLYGEGHFFDQLVIYVNKDGHSDTKHIDMPWQLDFYRHSIRLKDGWWTMYEKDRKKAYKKARKTGEKVDWDDRRFWLSDDDESILKKKFKFRYITKNKEVQDTTATCFIEEREWRPKWFAWTGLFKCVSTVLNIQFDDEMGNQRGSWKGGVMGVSAKMTKDEKESLDMESALRRYELDVTRKSDFDR